MPLLDASAVPPADPLAAAVLDLHRGLREHRRSLVEDALRRLYAEAGAFDGLCRRRGMRSAADLDEARHRIVLRIHQELSRSSEARILCPRAYARRAADWALLDMIRDERRRGEGLDPGALTLELERAGVHAPRGAPQLRPAAELLAAVCARVEDELRARDELDEGGLPESARRQIAAWLLLRFEGRPATEVAARLGAAGLSQGGTTAVYKWSERGERLLVRVARLDDAHESGLRDQEPVCA